MSSKQIIAKLKRKPGKTAQELGVPVGTMRMLAQLGLVKASGKRETGKRGRPAIEWTVAQ